MNRCQRLIWLLLAACTVPACGGQKAAAPAAVVAAPKATEAKDEALEPVLLDPNATAADPNVEVAPPLEVGQSKASPEALKSFRAGEAVAAEDPNAAFEDFVRAASQDPNFYGASYNAGSLAARLGDDAAAERYFQAALHAEPTFGPAAAGLASLYERRPGKMSTAEQLLRAQLSVKDNAPARGALAQLLVRTNRLDEAQREAIATLHLDERSPTAMLTLGMVYRRQHKYELSQLALGQAIEVDPGQGEAYNELGLVYLAQSEKAKAVQAFQKAATASPRVAAIQNNLGVLQTDVGAFKAAVQSLRAATELAPERAEYVLNLGNALRGDQQYVEAEKAYRQALQAGNKGALFNLGVLYLDNEIPGKDTLTRYRECMGYLQTYSGQVSDAAESAHLTEYLQTAQKAIDTETKRAARDKQRKEKEAAAGTAAAKPAAAKPAVDAAAVPAPAPAPAAPAPKPAAAPATVQEKRAEEPAPNKGAKHKPRGKHKSKGHAPKKRGNP